MNIAYITRSESFNAAHRLYNKNWSDEQNQLIFGKCANPNYHGHNYTLEVTIKGSTNPETGFIVNAKELSNIINEYIIDKIDHKNLNLDVDFMQGKFTSVENLTISIWEILEPVLKTKGILLHKVKLQETPTIYAEYFGEKNN